MYFFQGRKEEDVFPAYYRINSPSQITEAAREGQFRVIEILSTCSTAQFVAIPAVGSSRTAVDQVSHVESRNRT